MASYGRSDYWDERYTKDSDPFEWYQRYSSLREIIRESGIMPADNILMIGCGNSRLSEDMVNDGYEQITNVDISRVVIKSMVDKYSEHKGLKYQYGDVRRMPEFLTGSFRVAIDKGTMDSLLCGDGSTDDVFQMLKEIHRVLEPNGLFMIISYGKPPYRLCHLQKSDFSWEVTVKTVTKTSTVMTGNEADWVHYIYICKKHEELKDGQTETEVPQLEVSKA